MNYTKTRTTPIDPVELPEGARIEGFWEEGAPGTRHPFGTFDAGFWTVDQTGLHTFVDRDSMTNYWDRHQ